MVKELVVTALGNRIEYATTNGNGLITGKREDITEQAVNAVFAYFKSEFERKNVEGKGFGTSFGEHGRLMYLKPNTEVIWKEETKKVHLVEVSLKSNKTERVIKASYTARQLLDFFDESDLVIEMSKCECQPIGETNFVECNCDEEWEDYTLIVGD